MKPLIFVFAVAGSALAQTVSQEISDLRILKADYDLLATQLRTYDGTYGDFFEVLGRVRDVINQTKKSNGDLAAVPAQLNDTNTDILLNYISNSLEPSVNAAMTDYVAQKPKFPTDTYNLTSIYLNRLRGNTTVFGNTVITKSSNSRKTVASLAVAKVTNDIARAQKAYA